MVSVIAHRGASGLALENSLAAFRLAAELGADGIELDVHVTGDGAIVVHHDPVLSDGRWIRDLPATEVRRHHLANGESPPFLNEVIAAVPGLYLWIEVKALDPRWDPALLAAIDEAPGRCAVHSFDHRLIARLGCLRPALPRGVLSVSYPVDPLAQLRDTGADTLWQEWQLIDRGLVDLVHGAGCRLIAWTVNDRAVAERLAAIGVDGLCGNYPDRLRLT